MGSADLCFRSGVGEIDIDEALVVEERRKESGEQCESKMTIKRVGNRHVGSVAVESAWDSPKGRHGNPSRQPSVGHGHFFFTWPWILCPLVRNEVRNWYSPESKSGVDVLHFSMGVCSIKIVYTVRKLFSL